MAEIDNVMSDEELDSFLGGSSQAKDTASDVMSDDDFDSFLNNSSASSSSTAVQAGLERPAPVPQAPAPTWESGDGGVATLPEGETNQWGGNLRTEGRKPLIRRDANGKVSGYSTTSSMFVKHADGRIAVVPTVVDGRELSTKDAAKHYADTGEFWGMADDEEGAKKIAGAVHDEHQKAYQKGWNDYIYEHWDEMGDEIRHDPGVRGERARRKRDARLAEEMKAWGKDAEVIKRYRERTKTTQVAPELFLTGDLLEDADGRTIKPGATVAVFRNDSRDPFDEVQDARLMEFTGVNDDGKPVFKEVEGISPQGAMLLGKLHVNEDDFSQMLGSGEGKVSRSPFEQVRLGALAETGDRSRYTDDMAGTARALFDRLAPFVGRKAPNEHLERNRHLSNIYEGRLDGYEGNTDAEKYLDAARKAGIEPWNPLDSFNYRPNESDDDLVGRIKEVTREELRRDAMAKLEAGGKLSETEASVMDKIVKGGIESGGYALEFALPGGAVFRGAKALNWGAKAVRAATMLGSAVPVVAAEATSRYQKNVTPEYGFDEKGEFKMVAAPDEEGEAAYKAIGGAIFDTGVEVGLESATMGLLRLAGKPVGWALGRATPGAVKAFGAKKFNKFMASETGQALRSINRAYQDFALTTGINSPFGELLEENVQAFEKVLGLDGKSSEYKGLAKEWQDFKDNQLNWQTQWDIFYGLIAQLAVGSAKSTAEGVARHISEADVRRDIRMALKRSDISDETISTLTPKQQKVLNDMWQRYSADPDALKDRVKNLGMSMRLAVDELTARESSNIAADLKRNGIAPERFVVQSGVDGKPAFQQMERYTPDGKKTPMKAMTDAAHGVTIVDAGDGTFYVMNDWRGLDARPAEDFQKAQAIADEEVLANQKKEAENRIATQRLIELTDPKTGRYRGRNVVSIPSESALRWQVAQAVRDGRPLFGITRADQLFKADGSLKQPGAGGFHTPDGHIVVILDNVPSPAEMERVLAHEATGHEGVESATGRGANTVEFIQNAQAEGFGKFVLAEQERAVQRFVAAGMDEATARMQVAAAMSTDDYAREAMARYAQGRIHQPTWYERRKHEQNQRRRDAGESVPIDQSDLEVMLAEAEAQGSREGGGYEPLPGDSGVEYFEVEKGATDETGNGADEAQPQQADEDAGRDGQQPAPQAAEGPVEVSPPRGEAPDAGVVEPSNTVENLRDASDKASQALQDAESRLSKWLKDHPRQETEDGRVSYGNGGTVREFRELEAAVEAAREKSESAEAEYRKAKSAENAERQKSEEQKKLDAKKRRDEERKKWRDENPVTAQLEDLEKNVLLPAENELEDLLDSDASTNEQKSEAYRKVREARKVVDDFKNKHKEELEQEAANRKARENANGESVGPSKTDNGGQKLTSEAKKPKGKRGDNLRGRSYEDYAASPDDGGTADEMGAALLRFVRDNGGLLKMPPKGVADPMADWINAFLDGGGRKKNRGEFIALFGMKPKTGANDAIAENMPTDLKDYVEKMIKRDGPGAVADWFLETRRKYREWAQGRRDAAREERLAAKDRADEGEALESFDFDELAAARDAMDEEFANALGVVEGADEADYAALTPASLQIAKSGDTIRFDHDRKSFVFGSFDAGSGVLVVYDEDVAGMEGGKFRRAYRVTENSIEEIDDEQGNEVRADADRAGDEKGPAGGGGEAQGGGFRLESVTAEQITAEEKKRREKAEIKKRQEAPLKGSGAVNVQPEMDLGQTGQQDLFSPTAENGETPPAAKEKAAERPVEYLAWLEKYKMKDTDRHFAEWQRKRSAQKPAKTATASAPKKTGVTTPLKGAKPAEDGSAPAAPSAEKEEPRRYRVNSQTFTEIEESQPFSDVNLPTAARMFEGASEKTIVGSIEIAKNQAKADGTAKLLYLPRSHTRRRVSFQIEDVRKSSPVDWGSGRLLSGETVPVLLVKPDGNVSFVKIAERHFDRVSGIAEQNGFEFGLEGYLREIGGKDFELVANRENGRAELSYTDGEDADGMPVRKRISTDKEDANAAIKDLMAKAENVASRATKGGAEDVERKFREARDMAQNLLDVLHRGRQEQLNLSRERYDGMKAAIADAKPVKIKGVENGTAGIVKAGDRWRVVDLQSGFYFGDGASKADAMAESERRIGLAKERGDLERIIQEGRDAFAAARSKYDADASKSDVAVPKGVKPAEGGKSASGAKPAVWPEGWDNAGEEIKGYVAPQDGDIRPRREVAIAHRSGGSINAPQKIKGVVESVDGDNVKVYYKDGLGYDQHDTFKKSEIVGVMPFPASSPATPSAKPAKTAPVSASRAGGTTTPPKSADAPQVVKTTRDGESVRIVENGREYEVELPDVKFPKTFTKATSKADWEAKMAEAKKIADELKKKAPFHSVINPKTGKYYTNGSEVARRRRREVTAYEEAVRRATNQAFDEIGEYDDSWDEEPTNAAQDATAPTAARTTATSSSNPAKPVFKRGDRVFLKGAKDGQRVTFLKANADGTADVQVRTPGANRYALEKVETRTVPMGDVSSTGMKDTLTGDERNAYRRGVAEQTREAMRNDPALQRIDAAYRAAKTDAERAELKAQFAERVRALQGGVNFDTPELAGPSGRQKQAGIAYPDASEEIRAQVSFDTPELGKKSREDFGRVLAKHRPDLDANAVIGEIAKFDTPKKRKTALHWVVRGAIRLPEDAYKVEDALSVAEKAKVDPFAYRSPLELIEAHKDIKPTRKAIDPATVSELSDPRDEGDGIVSYEVADTREGQAAMRRIIDTHWGKDANPWCLLARNNPGDRGFGNWTDRIINGERYAEFGLPVMRENSTPEEWRAWNEKALKVYRSTLRPNLDEAWTYWQHYSALPKRVAFKNGKLLAFMATERLDLDNWSDYQRFQDRLEGRYPERVREYKSWTETEEAIENGVPEFLEWMKVNYGDEFDRAWGTGGVAEEWWDRQDESHPDLDWAHGNAQVNFDTPELSPVTPAEDAAYMDAVRRGDMETAGRMVREAAKQHGYKVAVFHGTPSGGFSVFKTLPAYVTENKEYADKYQSPTASSIRFGKQATQPETKSLFLDPRRMFDTRRKAVRDRFFDEYVQGGEEWTPVSGMNIALSRRGLPDWTEAESIADYIRAKHLPYDSIVVDEGGYPDLNGNVQDRGISYAVLKGSKLKSADPVTYDDAGNVIPLSQRFNPQKDDIRFDTPELTPADGRKGVSAEWGYNPRSNVPNVRGGWTEQKILRYLKANPSLHGVRTAARLISEFDTVDELKDHMFYHGTRNYVDKMQPSMTQSERWTQEHGGGGYGQRYWGISVSKSKKVASNFGNPSPGVSIYPVVLAKGAKVIDRPDLTDAADVEDHIVELWNDGVDAVRLGDWKSDHSEQELLVLNPSAICNIGTADSYRYFRLGSEENPLDIKDDAHIARMLEAAREYADYSPVKRFGKPTPPSMFVDGSVGELKPKEVRDAERALYEKELAAWRDSEQGHAAEDYEWNARDVIRFDTPELTPAEAEYVASGDKTPTEKVMREVYGMTNDEIATALKAAGMEPPAHVRKTDADMWRQVELLLSNSTYMAKLSRAVAKFPRPTRDYENVALNVLFRQRQAAVNDLERRRAELAAIPEDDMNKTPELRDELKQVSAKLAQAKTQMAEAGKAAMMGASEQGRALRSNRALIAAHDYSYAGIAGRIAQTLGGVEKITPEMNARIRDLAKLFEGLDAESLRLATERLIPLSKKVIDQTKNGLKVRKATERKVGDVARKVAQNYQDALTQIEVGAVETGGTLVGLSDQQYPSWGKWLRQIGEYHCFLNPEITEEEVIDAIVRDISPFMDGVDANQVRDALTGFGHNYKQSRYDAQRLMNSLRNISRSKRQIDWMDETNTMPPATGPIRDEPTQDEREWAKRVRDRKEEVPDAGRDERRLKSTLDTIKRNLENRIADLKRAIETGERIPAPKRKVVDDIRVRELRAEKDELQKQYDELFGTTREMTDAQRIALTEKLLAKELERAMEDFARAQAGDFSKRPQRPGVTSATIEAQRDRIRQVRESIRELKNAKYAFGMTPEEVEALNARKMASREKALARLAERIATGDIRPQKKPQPPMTKDQQKRYDELGEQMKRGRQKLAELRLEAENATVPTFVRKGVNFLRFVTTAQRALRATMDFSAVLRQAARMTLGHPVKAAQAFGKAWTAARSEASLLDVNTEILSDPTVQEAVKKFGLHLREVDAQSDRDVEMFHGMERNKVKIFGKEYAITDIPLFGEFMLKSERHYLTYLNAMSTDLYTSIVNGIPGGATPWQKKMVADMINIWNGSAALSKERRQALQKAWVNDIFWAPQLAISRVQSAVGYDIWHPLVAKGIKNADGTFEKVSNDERRTAAKVGLREHLRSTVAMLAIGALLKWLFSDDDDKYDFSQADWFEKMMMLVSPKIGNTTIDLTGGESTFNRLVHQLATKSKRSGTGRLMKFGDFNGPTTMGTIGRYLQGKLSPSASTIVALWEGKDYVGEEYGVGKMVREMLVPLTFEDVKDQIVQNGVGKSLVTVPLSILGAGGSTYDRKPYENAVNRFLEAKKEYDAIQSDDSVSGDERNQRLSDIREGNPLMRNGVREKVSAQIKRLKSWESKAKKAKKAERQTDELDARIERQKAEILDMIRAARK